ncbi:DNA polymerase III subunit gamma/tau [Negadavirga shengliensis]|uniref:DNA polymerase III subunit gamma/tau n=1 Tax=Negadavirga shengliensis TaxID=1389218 RepID=A0ABV9SYB5_9BACT
MGAVKSEVKKTLSIPSSITAVRKQMAAKPKLTEEALPEAPAEETEPIKESKTLPLTEDSLKNALEEVILAFKANHKNLEVAVLKQPYEIHESQVVFILSGGLQEDIFIKVKPELTGMLRKKLQHAALEVAFEIREEEVDPAKNLYTSREKLTYLLDKSPALKELQRRFGLETDF